MLQPTKDLLLRLKGSMTRQELQQQVYSTPAVTAPARPQGLLTQQEVEDEKNGPNGEVVQLADQKPTGTTEQAGGPSQSAVAEDQAGAAEVQAKPRVPGVDAPQVNNRAIRKQSRDLADRVMGMNDIMRIVNRVYPQQTEEDIEAQQRKEKRDALLATIGDGLSSFHEAYSKMRGVQPMTNGTSLTGKMRERRERMDRERQEIDAKRQALAINWAKLKQQQRTAEDLADYRSAMAEYYAQQPQKWANEFQVKQQEAQNKKEHMERQDAETERNNKEKTAIQDKARQDRKAAAAASNQTRKEIAKVKEAGVQRRFNQREANKQAKDKKKSPTGGSGKTKKQSPTAKK